MRVLLNMRLLWGDSIFTHLGLKQVTSTTVKLKIESCVLYTLVHNFVIQEQKKVAVNDVTITV